MPILGGTGNVSEYAYRSFLVEYPDFFDWPNITNAQPGITYYSGYARVTGIKTKLPISITSGYSYSLYSNVFDNGQTVTFDNNRTYEASFDEFSDPNLRFTTQPGKIKNRQSINLKLTTNLIPSFKKTSFDADRFRFNDYNPRFSSENEPVDAFSGDFNTVYRPIVSVGKTTQDWIVQTKTLDQTPNPFSFVSFGPTTTGISVTSISVTILGLEPYYRFPADIIFGTFSGISVDDKVPLSSTQVHNGSIIKLITVTPTTFNTSKTIESKVGTFSTTWTVTTEVQNSNITFTPSDFTDLTNLQLNTITDSNKVTLSGFSLNSSLPVTLSNSNAKYEVERNSSIIKSFDAAPIQVTNNDIVRLRLTSSGSYNTPVTTTMTVGNTSADWKITTRTAPAPGASLTATTTTINQGQSVTLTWSSTDATSVSSSNFGATTLSGTTTVNPTATTIYTITVSGPGGSATATVTVTVTPKPTVTLTASSTSITLGDSTTLTWSSTNATSVVLSTFGATTTSGSITITPTSTTSNYLITVSGPAGTATAIVTVIATAAPTPTPTTTVTLTASPTSITSGNSTTLTWSSTNATSVSSSNFGATAVSGTITVSPTTTTPYTITVSGSSGTATATATVTVTATTTVTLTASPTSITSGNSTTLTWSSTNATSVTSTNFGATTVNGTKTVSPTTSTNYSITVSGSGGSATSSASVAVTAPPPVCTVETRTSFWGTGFKGYLLYGNGSKEIATNGSDGFITSIKSEISSDFVTNTAGATFTYQGLSSTIINTFLSLGRYPETIGYDGWFNLFLRDPAYTSYSVLVTAIQTAFVTDGERDYRIARGGLVGNYDNCDIKRA